MSANGGDEGALNLSVLDVGLASLALLINVAISFHQNLGLHTQLLVAAARWALEFVGASRGGAGRRSYHRSTWHPCMALSLHAPPHRCPALLACRMVLQLSALGLILVPIFRWGVQAATSQHEGNGSKFSWPCLHQEGSGTRH